MYISFPNVFILLQTIKMDNTQPPAKCVFINPNFKTAHINPKFIKSMATDSIHVNPNFLAQFQTLNANDSKSGASSQGRIIAKSKNKLIREPMNVEDKVIKSELSMGILKSADERRLIKIGTRKLIRAPIKEAEDKVRKLPTAAKISPLAKKKRYKIDRRAPKVKVKASPIRKNFTGRYALSRVAESELLAPRRIITRGRRVCRLERTLTKDKALLNINGVLYKSSKNKLEKTLPKPIASQPNTASNPLRTSARKRVVIVRGKKFLLDNGGRSLRKLETKDNTGPTLKRIDIGGLTYVANSQNILIRTDYHKTRNYLSSAKQKSINVLSRCLVKSNIPCPIFRKVGKCSAYERGKCTKVHDKKHVAICRKFLKGECVNEKCLLSHEISLSKMPTCKFFLQGCCTRPNCPYLHKKLNEKTEICTEFLKGFCQLAEKCTKRHEFLCPDFESKGKCDKPRCPHLHKKIKNDTTGKNSEQMALKVLRVENKPQPIPPPKQLNDEDLAGSSSRYYFSDKKEKELKLNSSEPSILDEHTPSDDDSSKPTLRGRKKLGDLPAFIPL